MRPRLLTAWWKTFHDPVLDALVDRAVQSNLDLRIAQARVLEARAQYGIAFSDLWPSASVSASYARQGQSHHQPILGSLKVPPERPFENNVYQPASMPRGSLMCSAAGVVRWRPPERRSAAIEYGRRATLMTLLGDVAEITSMCAVINAGWPLPTRTSGRRKEPWPSRAIGSRTD